MISHWKLNHVEALFKEFEASKILLELSDRVSALFFQRFNSFFLRLPSQLLVKHWTFQADSARPQLRSIGNELLASEHKDFTIKFKVLNHSFLVNHNIIEDYSLRVHCFLARVRLALLPHSSNGIVSIDSLLSPLVNISHIEKFFHWLYTDDWNGDEAVLSQLR